METSDKKVRKEARRKEIQLKKRKLGICSICNLPALDGIRLCQKHKDYLSQSQKNYRKKKKLAGLCIKPGCKTPTNGNSYCKECLNIQHQLQPEKFRCGLSEENYNKMINNQNSLCMICKNKFDNLCVDHDHATGKIRGLLCHLCNSGLGCFKDNTSSLINAIAYLSESKNT